MASACARGYDHALPAGGGRRSAVRTRLLEAVRDKTGTRGIEKTLLFGSPADLLGPVALRPRLTPGLPFLRADSHSNVMIAKHFKVPRNLTKSGTNRPFLLCSEYPRAKSANDAGHLHAIHGRACHARKAVFWVAAAGQMANLIQRRWAEIRTHPNHGKKDSRPLSRFSRGDLS